MRQMEKESANMKQIAGTHYLKPIQPWDYIIQNNLGFLEGNIIKYITRYKDKNGLEDLNKCKHYLDKLIETELNKQLPRNLKQISIKANKRKSK